MTNDFQLFADPPHGDAPTDADTDLIMAYLARELTPVQVAAVEDRMANDPAFRDAVWPIIEAWCLPGSLTPNATPGTGPRPTHEIPGAASPQAPARGALTLEREKRMTRVAAVLAFIVLPAIGFTQLVVYAATNVDAPGHEIARAIVPAAILPPPAPATRPRSPSLQQAIPLVDLTTPAAKTTQTFRAVLGIKESKDGLLVNDAVMKRVYLLDSSLSVVSVPLDTVPGSAQSYGYNSNGVRIPLMLYVGDSSLLSQDGRLAAFRVLDGRGQIIRAIDANFGRAFLVRETGGFDPMGRALFAFDDDVRLRETPVQNVSVPPSAFLPRPVPTPRPDGGAGGSGRIGNAAPDGSIQVVLPMRPDSIAIQRVDLEARRVDTVAYFKLPVGQVSFGPNAFGGGRLVVGYSADGKPNSIRQLINPVEAVDVWALLSDGTVAVVRARDYHVDWTRPDGTKSSSPKISYEMNAITEAEKQHLVDSTRACLDSVDAWVAAASEADLARLRRGAESGVIEGGRDAILTSPGVPPRPACMPPLRRNASGVPQVQPGELQPRSIRYEIVPLADIPDYYPPFRQRAARADADGNLWVLPRMTKLSRRGELVYDVINPQRGLVRRVRLPEGRSIAGFGKSAVYLQFGTLADGFVLERYALPK